MTTATLTFPTRTMAQEFSIQYGRFSHLGNTMGSGNENVFVKVDVVEGGKEWIDSYIANINK